MAKRRANGEGNLRKRKDGRWEGRYTAGHDPETGKAIYRDQLNQKNGEKLREIEAFLEQNTGTRYRILAVTDGELQKGAPPPAESDLADVIKNIHSDITWE